MKESQCLEYALTKWNEEGGYLVLGKSTHWCIPHVLHMSSNTSLMTHFVPHTDLDTPWYSILGFKGYIKVGDNVKREPISAICMLIGTLVLLLLGGKWALKHKFRQYFKK